MRIRLPFAAAFFILSALAAYTGLTALQLDAIVNDKVLHFTVFFALTTTFYWILDTSRRRALNLTFFVCTICLGIGSEILQGFLPNDRIFDVWDIVANLAGSLSALGLSTWYHTRMLERKRLKKVYTAVPGQDDDVELGGVGTQEEGVVRRELTAEEELDNWDENVEDNWDEDEAPGTDSVGGKTPSASDAEEAPKRKD